MKETYEQWTPLSIEVQNLNSNNASLISCSEIACISTKNCVVLSRGTVNPFEKEGHCSSVFPPT